MIRDNRSSLAKEKPKKIGFSVFVGIFKVMTSAANPSAIENRSKKLRVFFFTKLPLTPRAQKAASNNYFFRSNPLYANISNRRFERVGAAGGLRQACQGNEREYAAELEDLLDLVDTAGAVIYNMTAQS